MPLAGLSAATSDLACRSLVAANFCLDFCSFAVPALSYKYICMTGGNPSQQEEKIVGRVLRTAIARRNVSDMKFYTTFLTESGSRYIFDGPTGAVFPTSQLLTEAISLYTKKPLEEVKEYRKRAICA